MTLDPRIRDLAADLGVDLSTAPPGRGYQWDGRSIATGGVHDADVLHDIAHWLVAAKRRRQLPEFGLGPSPSAHAQHTQRHLSYQFAQDEESMASLLGIAWERRLGMDWKDTVMEHGWRPMDSTMDRDHRRRMFRALRKRLQQREHVPMLTLRHLSRCKMENA